MEKDKKKPIKITTGRPTRRRQRKETRDKTSMETDMIKQKKSVKTTYTKTTKRKEKQQNIKNRRKKQIRNTKNPSSPMTPGERAGRGCRPWCGSERGKPFFARLFPFFLFSHVSRKKLERSQKLRTAVSPQIVKWWSPSLSTAVSLPGIYALFTPRAVHRVPLHYPLHTFQGRPRYIPELVLVWSTKVMLPDGGEFVQSTSSAQQ